MNYRRSLLEIKIIEERNCFNYLLYSPKIIWIRFIISICVGIFNNLRRDLKEIIMLHFFLLPQKELFNEGLTFTFLINLFPH